MRNLRIVSLLPAATEIVYLLGLQKHLVGVSHECDYPPQVKNILKITSSPISNEMSSLQIDQAIKSLIHRGSGVFHIKQEVLKKLKPNLILTQELCEVCAVGFNQARHSARILDSDVKIISLEPESVEDILENIRVVGEYTGKDKKAIRVIGELRGRLRKIKERLPPAERGRNDRKKVLVVEWLDPIMVAGHWVPEMVEIAGGVNLITKFGQQSKAVKIDQIRASNPDILIISPCGFDIQRTIQERFMIDDLRLKINNKNTKVYLVDGNSYMTRPGPRIMDGIEILAEILHPDPPFGGPRRYTKKDWLVFSSL